LAIRRLILFSGGLIFIYKREHLLSALLRLEFMRLGIFYCLIIFLGLRDLFYSLIYLTFTACEGALGLGVLVVIRRTHGGDYFKVFSVV